MSIDQLSLFFDVLILIGLGTTIYFALRLTHSLANFRMQRKEFEKMIKELNGNIERAHRSLLEMKGFGALDDDENFSIEEARALLDELKLMNRSGNSLADRLEQLASQSRYARQFNSAPDDDDTHDYDEQLYNNIATLERANVRAARDDAAFAIQDRDFETPATSALPSKAEQELMQALKKNKRSRA